MNKVTYKSFMATVLLSTLLLSGCGSDTVSANSEANSQISLESKLRSLTTDLEWTYKSYTSMKEKDTSLVIVENQDGRLRLYLYVIENEHYLAKKELLIETTSTQTISDIKAVSEGIFSYLFKEVDVEQTIEYDYKNNTVISREQSITEEENINPLFQGEFSKIQEILYNSQQGLIEDATFILVGDSTRAVSANNGKLLYDTLQNALKSYNFTENNNSFLQARGSHQLAHFNEETPTMIRPTYHDIIALIPNDGANSIVDMSLGVNDFYHWHEEYIFNTPALTAEVTLFIEAKLKTAIDHILMAKPATNIYLTMPNPQRDWEQATKTYRNAYINVAKEYKLPLIDFVSEIMPAFDERVVFESWYRDGIHFTDEALKKTANHILTKITPKKN